MACDAEVDTTGALVVVTEGMVHKVMNDGITHGGVKIKPSTKMGVGTWERFTVRIKIKARALL